MGLTQSGANRYNKLRLAETNNGKDDFRMKNETPDFGKKGPQYGNWIPYSLVMVSLAAALALLFAGNALKNVVGWLSSALRV